MSRVSLRVPGGYVGEVLSYRNEPGRGVFCQIKLAGGDRVLVTVAGEVKLVVQPQGSRLPAATLWSCKDVDQLVKLFGRGDNAGKHPLDAIRDTILAMASIEELQRFLAAEP